MLGCYINPVHLDEAARRREVDRFIERLRYAKDIGADMVGTETGRFSPDMAVTALTQSEECWRVLLGSFSRIAREAEALGVTVGVEGVFDHTLSTPERMARFLRDLDSPAVRVILDFANLVPPDALSAEAQRSLAERAFSLYGERIAVLHLKDCVFENGAQRCVRPGTGVVRWEEPMRLIARELLETLRREGIPVAMVADGLAESFRNVYRGLGLESYFARRIYSSDVGAEKPSPLMFETALRAMGLTEADKERIVMMGNHVKKDIAGANRFGITSVLLDWSHRYPTVPETPDETPDFIVHTPLDLLEVLSLPRG